jgi:signal peptidase I
VNNGFRIAQNVILGAVALVGGTSFVLVLVVLLGSYTPVIVTSGSMEPTLPYGSLLMTKKAPAQEVRTGDIVTVPRTDAAGVVTHRITSIETHTSGKHQITMRGDANSQDDPKPYFVDNVQKFAWQLKYFGKAILWVQNHVIATCAILVGSLGLAFFDRTRVSVTLPDGQELKNLTKAEANRVLRTVAAMGGTGVTAAEPTEPDQPDDPEWQIDTAVNQQLPEQVHELLTLLESRSPAYA